jgi:FAD binding domain
MNTGIGDAINLAWKLGAVVRGNAPDRLLDSYEAERIGFARRLVARTDRVFSFVTAEGRIADIIRMRVAPVLIPTAMIFEAAREFLFRTVSQITLNYRGGPLSVGAAGHVNGSDRLPWVSIDRKDNCEPQTAMNWQVHIYGSASAELAAWCASHDVPLHVFSWRPDHETAGLARDAIYLLRPDTYVALADTSSTPDALDRDCADHGIRILMASKST